MTRNPLARAADQRIVRKGEALTVHDKAHSPSWRRPGSRGAGEITFKVSHENGVPILTVQIVEVDDKRDSHRPEGRETTFHVYGTNALEALELIRDLELTPVTGPKGGI